jgi:parallel beta-helix repeat protein
MIVGGKGMKRNYVGRKSLTFGIILFFIGICIVPCIQSESLSGKNIITVDDEPGDADFTSITEAVDASDPGDTIEVYSGTYPEEKILFTKENISLLGISHELGTGNDSGKPFLKGNGTDSAIWVIAAQTTISGFMIQKEIGQGSLIDIDYVPGCRISNNTLQNGTTYQNTGIDCFNTTNVQIRDNIIENMNGDGIFFEQCHNAYVYNNRISNSEYGIYLDSSESINITKNKIDGCNESIMIVKGSNITLYLNTLKNNSIGLNLILSGKTIIKHNNFINNSQRDVFLLAGKVIITQQWESIRNSWIENFWSDWSKKEPKIIPGVVFLLIVLIPISHFIIPIGIPLPLIQSDRNPAQEPYDIGG